MSRTHVASAERPRIRARHAAGESLRAIAAEYGVSYETIRAIVRRAT
jgi:hypothetical protein